MPNVTRHPLARASDVVSHLTAILGRRWNMLAVFGKDMAKWKDWDKYFEAMQWKPYKYCGAKVLRSSLCVKTGTSSMNTAFHATKPTKWYGQCFAAKCSDMKATGANAAMWGQRKSYVQRIREDVLGQVSPCPCTASAHDSLHLVCRAILDTRQASARVCTATCSMP
jgi:hypothetical protein